MKERKKEKGGGGTTSMASKGELIMFTLKVLKRQLSLLSCVVGILTSEEADDDVERVRYRIS